jgi:hypothetical protein
MTTYVVIYGAGSDSWYWHLVASELRAHGHAVVAPDLPCDDDAAGLSEYVDVVVEAIGSAPSRSIAPLPLVRRSLPVTEPRRLGGRAGCPSLVALAELSVPARRSTLPTPAREDTQVDRAGTTRIGLEQASTLSYRVAP